MDELLDRITLDMYHKDYEARLLTYGGEIEKDAIGIAAVLFNATTGRFWIFASGMWVVGEAPPQTVVAFSLNAVCAMISHGLAPRLIGVPADVDEIVFTYGNAIPVGRQNN